MLNLINSRLSEVEAENNVRIIFACESGSRAWGFPSKNSDYDVRFIYIHPVQWYLSVDEKRDVLEFPLHDQLDMSGWDLKKALKLLRKTNPPLLEWLGSPIVYLEKYSTAAKMRRLAAKCYSPSACLFHYLHMAQGNFREYLHGDTVWIKKYFYVLRPILAMKWIEEGHGIVPTDFNVFLENLELPDSLRRAVLLLLKSKRNGNELDRGRRIPAISNYIESELARWEDSEIPRSLVAPNGFEFDTIFRESLEEVW